MKLAGMAGIDVADVELTHALGKDILLVDRFDRDGHGCRRAMVSAATVIETTGMAAIYGSYALLADQIRARFTDPDLTLRAVQAPHVQYPDRQHRRPRPQSGSFLGWIDAVTDPRL